MPMQGNERERLETWLEARRLLDGGRSRWDQPIWRPIVAGHEPQRLMDASALQRRLVACAHGTPAPGDGLCAAWVEQVFSRLGMGVVLGDAAALYQDYCHYTDTADLKVGMVVATGRHPFTMEGRRRGHVGLYVGDCVVMDAVGERVRKVPVELWLSTYGLMDVPRWGWLGSMGLTSGQ